MSMFANVQNLYYGKKIGIVEIMQACQNGWITEAERDQLMSENVIYNMEEAVRFKRRELSAICTQTIMEGIDVTLSDGITRHFSLSEKDQINLQAKTINIATGVTQLEYHSDGQPCCYYSAEDMMLICATAQAKVTYETTYYNCLTQWVAGCTTPDEISAIKYGVDVPEQYWSDPWRNIMASAMASQNQDIVDATPEVEFVEK